VKPLFSFRVHPRHSRRYFIVNVWKTKINLLKHFGRGYEVDRWISELPLKLHGH